MGSAPLVTTFFSIKVSFEAVKANTEFGHMLGVRRKRTVNEEYGPRGGGLEKGKVQAVIVAKLDRLTRSVKDLCELLERFERRGVALISVAESLDTGSAAGRLVLNIMAAVSQWDGKPSGSARAMRSGTSAPTASGLAIFSSDIACAPTGGTSSPTPANKPC